MKKISLIILISFTLQLIPTGHILFASQKTEIPKHLVFLQSSPSQNIIHVIDSNSSNIIASFPLSSITNINDASTGGNYVAIVGNFNTEAYLLNLQTKEFKPLLFLNPNKGYIEKIILTNDGKRLAWSTSQINYLGILKSSLFISDINGNKIEKIMEETYGYKNNPETSYAIAPVKWTKKNEYLYFEKFLIDNGRTLIKNIYPCYEHFFLANTFSKNVKKLSKDGECVTDISYDDTYLATKTKINEIWKEQFRIRNLVTNQDITLDTNGQNAGNFKFSAEKNDFFGFTSFVLGLYQTWKGNLPVALF